MKPIRWPFWAGLATLIGAWLIAGAIVPNTDFPANDMFNVAALWAFFAVLAFIAVYTVQGLLGPAKWWRNNIGTYLVLAAGSVLAIIAPTAFAVLFHHGQIDTHWWAWLWIGGHFLAAVMWTALAGLWIRNRPANGSQ